MKPSPALFPRTRPGWRLVAAAAALLAGAAIFIVFGLGGGGNAPSASTADAVSAAVGVPDADYVGGKSCAGCHAQAYDAWQGSQHARAMQHATAETVLGRFDGARFGYAGITSTFFKRDGRFFVNTDGPDGRLHDYEIKYTFGVEPLQQYLVAFPDGRMQALSLAWDSRPQGRGGQRWFHLYPGERVDHRHPLHWTRLNQNWNYMCAECHSTNLQRGYDAAADRYATTWSEINVACEACHGPGSDHLAWARKVPGWERMAASKGLAVRLDERRDAGWRIDPASGNAVRGRPLAAHREVERCALCHARRAPLTADASPAALFMDSHEPTLLTPGLYFADGQQQDEVYNYGSFLQSRMYAHGVTCSDCHEPHSAKLRAPGNAVCGQCHLPAKYDAPAHTRHAADSQGAQCVACHMPTRNYMAVDPRHDHSLRIPRPDLSLRLGTPNACNACHTEKDAKWAAAAIERAHGPLRKGFQTFPEALHAGRTGQPGAADQLVALVRDGAAPGIARATALAELQRFPGPETRSAVEVGLTDRDPLLRGAAIEASLAADPVSRARLVEPLLGDPVKGVRIKAARALAAVPLAGLTPERRARRERAFAEYVAAQEVNAERPEAHLNLGLFYIDRGDAREAEGEYRTALRLQPDFAPAYLNLADLYRALGREGDADAVLADGLQQASDDGDLLHAQGLLRTRQGRMAEALRLLARAARARPDNPRYAYVHGVALHDAGSRQEGLAVLGRALARFPNDRELLFALAAYARDAGDRAAAAKYAERLAALSPSDPGAQRLLGELRAGTKKGR